MKDVVIVSACRTAIGAFGGSLKNSSAAQLASITMKEIVKRSNIDPEIIDDIRYGNCMEPPNSCNVARVGALIAQLPESVPAV
ncbi:MAG: acetyl-CoA C-acyltransferase, partial [Desulfobacteraceae bacterium]|nr:acetyl-CoA C-acyltransferase [Desulfobacteraceae bacterium]